MSCAPPAGAGSGKGCLAAFCPPQYSLGPARQPPPRSTQKTAKPRRQPLARPPPLPGIIHDWCTTGDDLMSTRPCGGMQLLWTGVLLAAGAGAVSGGDWPMVRATLGNMSTSSDRRLPDWADCGVENDARGEPESTKNIKRAAEVGHPTTGSGGQQGRVFIGTTWEDGRTRVFVLDEKTGRRLGSFVPNPARQSGAMGDQFDPAIEVDRLYFVSPYQEAIHDLKIPSADALKRRRTGRNPRKQQGRRRMDIFMSIVWRYDAQLSVLSPYGKLLRPGAWRLCSRSATAHGSGKKISAVDPSLVAFNKMTGNRCPRRRRREQPPRQYTSPALGW